LSLPIVGVRRKKERRERERERGRVAYNRRSEGATRK